MARAVDLSALRGAFKGIEEPARGHAPDGASAIFVPLRETPQGLAVVYTKRSDSMRSHPGEVSFPGGRIDAEDDSPLSAALREMEEEIGFAPSEVETWGHFTDFTTHHGTLICAYAGLVPGDRPLVAASPDEVADVFAVPLSDLLGADSYEARRLPGMAPGRQVHYWHVKPHTVWGITGELTARFLENACGWEPPKPAKTIHDLGDFRPRRL